MAAKKPLGVLLFVLVAIACAAPLGYQQLSKMSLEEQSPAIIESWLLQAFPGEFEPGSVKHVDAPRTFARKVHLTATAMSKTGTISQVCVTFARDSLFGDWYALGECVPAGEAAHPPGG